MNGSWTFLALILVVVGLLIALNLWLTTRGSAGAAARLATGDAGDVGGPDADSEAGTDA